MEWTLKNINDAVEASRGLTNDEQVKLADLMPVHARDLYISLMKERLSISVLFK